MASDTILETYDPAVKSADDNKESFDFHCTATGVRQDQQKVPFLSRVGRESPRSLANVDLQQIMELM